MQKPILLSAGFLAMLGGAGLYLWQTEQADVLAGLEQADWSASVFESAELNRSDGALEIETQDGPGGLQLQRQLDPEKRYRLVVEGRGEAYTVRLGFDDDDLQYLPAPSDGDSPLTATISKQGSVELLVYSDDPASTYVLETVEISKCEQCNTAEDLRGKILSRIPGLQDMDTLEKAKALLKWSANSTNFAVGADALIDNFESLPVQTQFYDYMDENVGGVYCGGAAVFYSNILHKFDVDAFTINYGIYDPDITHVTVIVPHEGRHYIMDPTFAAFYEDGGRMVSLEEIFAGRFDDIELSEMSLAQRQFIGTVEARIDCADEPIQAGEHLICSIGEDSFVENYVDLFLTHLESVGLSSDALFLVEMMRLGMFNIGPSLDPATRELFAARVDEWGLPKHADL